MGPKPPLCSLVGVVVGAFLALLSGSGLAFGQTHEYGKLTVNSGPAIHNWQIARWIDTYFEDGNPGDGIVKSNIIYIETQSYASAGKYVNKLTDQMVGAANPELDKVRFDNTTYLAAQVGFAEAHDGGYHRGAASWLIPGLTAESVHKGGFLTKDAYEYPEHEGDLKRKVGGSSSTHVVVWTGLETELDKKDIDDILGHFQSASNTTLHVLAGNGSGDYGGLADSVGAATRANLLDTLQEIGLLMDDGVDEQFIFFVTGHGNCASTTSGSTACPANTTDQSVEFVFSADSVLQAVAETSNQPSMTLMTSQALSAQQEMGIAVGVNDLCFSDFLNADSWHKEVLEGPDGENLFTYVHEFPDLCLAQRTGPAAAGTVAQTLTFHNYSTTDLIIDQAILDLGALGRRDPSPEGIAVTAVARASGLGAFFKSRWDLFNPGPNDKTVEMTYTPRADIGGEPVTVEYVLAAGAMLELDDPFTEIFGMASGTAVGSVMIQVTEGGAGDLRMQTVVLARLGDGSEFGQFFPAVPVAYAVSAGETVWLNTTEDPTRSRVNVGVMGVEHGTSLTLTPVDPIGEPLATGLQIALDRGESSQVNNLDHAFSLGGRANYLVEVEVTSGAGFVYASVLDGNDGSGTSDPTTVLPVANGSSEVTLLEVGSIKGINEFSGSASITNHSSIPARVEARFYERGVPGVPAQEVFSVEPGRTVGFGDVIDDLFGIQGVVGTLVLTPSNQTSISATAREFAVFRDQGGEVTGTAGQLIAGLDDGDLLYAGRTWHFIGLRQRAGAAGIERSHIALYNPSDEPITATLALFDGTSGEAEGSIVRAIEPRCLIQINNVIEAINGNQDGSVKRLELSATGPVHARAFRVNTTGDPITIDAL